MEVNNRNSVGLKELKDLSKKIPIFEELVGLASKFENATDDIVRKRIAIKMQYLFHKGCEWKNDKYFCRIDIDGQVYRTPFSFLQLEINDRKSGATILFSERFLTELDYSIFKDLAEEHYWKPLNTRYRRLSYWDCPVPFGDEMEQLLQEQCG